MIYKLNVVKLSLIKDVRILINGEYQLKLVMIFIFSDFGNYHILYTEKAIFFVNLTNDSNLYFVETIIACMIQKYFRYKISRKCN